MADVAAIYPVLLRRMERRPHFNGRNFGKMGEKSIYSISRLNAAGIPVAVPAVPRGAHAIAQLSGDLPRGQNPL
jgi:hypothetical protein